LKDSGQFLARIAEIEASKEKSFDLLELIDGRLVECYSEVISAGRDASGRVWSFRIVAERQHSDLVALEVSLCLTVWIRALRLWMRQPSLPQSVRKRQPESG
jgi:hypothetical protein